jgi:hypothetical protein
MTTKSCKKVAQEFCCEKCDYSTCRKSSFEKHILSRKHVKDYKETTKSCTKVANEFVCFCGKDYKHHSSLWKHQKTCPVKPLKEVQSDLTLDVITNLFKEQLKENKELKECIIEQNKHIVDLASKVGGNNIIQNNTTNNNNFNLNFFLNEQCKDALNIMDFVNTIKLQLSDLDMMGKLGYAEGISKIFIRGLKELDVFKRPIHCSDLKRETLYIKDKDAWEKENSENIKIKQAIRYIEHQNMKQLPDWMKENPTAEDTDTKKHMDYVHIVHECMGGNSGESQEKKHNKIIRNIAKEVIIEK